MAIMQMDIKNPGEIAKMQSPGEDELMKFYGAVAPHYRRSATVSRVWGRHSPTRLTKGTNGPKGEIWATGRILLVLCRVPYIESANSRKA